MKMAGNGGATVQLTYAAFNRNNGSKGARVATRGYTTLFNGYSEEGRGPSVALDCTLTLDELRAAIAQAEADGVDTLQVRLSGRIMPARVVDADERKLRVAALTFEDAPVEAPDQTPAPTT